MFVPDDGRGVQSSLDAGTGTHLEHLGEVVVFVVGGGGGDVCVRVCV